jgi:hypothetical protein
LLASVLHFYSGQPLQNLSGVDTGFAGNELSQLWPRASALALEERRVGPFTHAFVAATASP